MKKTTTNNTADAATVIANLGGTNRTARMFMIAAPCVSNWKIKGIPPHWDEWLRCFKPEVFVSQSSPGKSIKDHD